MGMVGVYSDTKHIQKEMEMSETGSLVQCCGKIKIPDNLIGQEMLSCSSGPIRMSGIFILPQHWTNDPASVYLLLFSSPFRYGI